MDTEKIQRFFAQSHYQLSELEVKRKRVKPWALAGSIVPIAGMILMGLVGAGLDTLIPFLPERWDPQDIKLYYVLGCIGLFMLFVFLQGITRNHKNRYENSVRGKLYMGLFDCIEGWRYDQSQSHFSESVSHIKNTTGIFQPYSFVEREEDVLILEKPTYTLVVKDIQTMKSSGKRSIVADEGLIMKLSFTSSQIKSKLDTYEKDTSGDEEGISRRTKIVLLWPQIKHVMIISFLIGGFFIGLLMLGVSWPGADFEIGWLTSTIEKRGMSLRDVFMISVSIFFSSICVGIVFIKNHLKSQKQNGNKRKEVHIQTKKFGGNRMESLLDTFLIGINHEMRLSLFESKIYIFYPLYHDFLPISVRDDSEKFQKKILNDLMILEKLENIADRLEKFLLES